MTLFQSIILGIVQGLTEFLPISSSGHLVLFQNLFGMKEPMLTFDIALHAGTLFAVLVYFRKELIEILSGFWGSLCPCACASAAVQPLKKLWISILLTLIPTGLLAVFFKNFIEYAFSSLIFVACEWFVMGILLIASVKIREGAKTLGEINGKSALWIGLAQGISLLPAISRSGSTILTGMFLGIKREDAARFSFLISIPAILGAILLDLKDGVQHLNGHGLTTLVGFITSAITGYIVIRWLMGVIQRGRFFLFGYYCIAAGLFALIVTILS